MWVGFAIRHPGLDHLDPGQPARAETLFRSYSHAHFPFFGSIALNQQIGVLLLLALVLAVWAMLNWRPVVDYELREIEFEKRKIEHEQRMRQLRSETEQIKKENARLAELNAKLSAISSSSATNSTPPPSTPDESET